MNTGRHLSWMGPGTQHKSEVGNPSNPTSCFAQNSVGTAGSWRTKATKLSTPAGKQTG